MSRLRLRGCRTCREIGATHSDIVLKQKLVIPVEFTKGIVRTLLVPIGFVALMWSIEMWDFVLGMLVAGDPSHSMLDRLGIRPRTLVGIPGIVMAPFLHQGFGHLAGNSLPLLILGLVLALAGLRQLISATLIIILVTGACVWLLGSSGTVHIGASGLVFGYLGFLLVKGFIEKRVRWIVVSMVTGFFYASYLHGLLPGGEGISWLSHFFGFVSGILASWILARREAPSMIQVSPPASTSHEPRT